MHLVLCIFGEVILLSIASLVHYIFGGMHLLYGESLVWWILGMLHLWCPASLVSCIFGVMLSCSDASLAGFIFGGASLVRLLLFNASLVHCFLDPRGIFGQIWIQGARQTSSAQCCHYKKVSFGRHHLMGMKSLANAPQKMKKNWSLGSSIWCDSSMVCWIFGALFLCCAASLVQCKFGELYIYCNISLMN